MKLNRTELKKVMYDFNSFSNRLLKADMQDYNLILAKYLIFIENQPLIKDYISGCGEPPSDIASDVCEASRNHNVIFDTGDTVEQEVTNIFHTLKYLSDNNIRIPHDVGMGYSQGSFKYSECLKGFNERFVLVFIRHIEGYLTKIGIDMGVDESIKYSITNTGGQVIVATDSATVTATMNNGIDASALRSLIKTIMDATVGMNKNEIEAVQENIEVIENELKGTKPRKNFLNTALTGLKAIKGSAEFGAAVTTLVQFVQQYL
jgi:hypothetical protein